MRAFICDIAFVSDILECDWIKPSNAMVDRTTNLLNNELTRVSLELYEPVLRLNNGD